MRIKLIQARSCASILPFILLAACGGGGGGVSSTPTPSSGSTSSNPPSTTTTPTTETTTSTPAAPVTTTPTATTPSTTKSSVDYNDAEYKLSNVSVAANALAAYSAGATGAGVKIAIIDSGLADPGNAFKGRIDAASRDIVSNRGFIDQDGHGTSVAAVAAAGRDGSDMMGVAFDATVLVARTDAVGSCGSSTGCQHNDDMIAKGVDLARQNGAKVINMSLGGSAASSTLINSVKQAVAAGIVVVISSGNDGSANPDAFAQMAGNSAMNGMIIIAGSHDANFNMSSFSDRAGSYGQYYLTAMGEAVRSIDENFGHFLFSGTSYSAPTITGAIAVLAQAFPNMTGKQLVDLLYSTATDAGATGVDSVYGHGILNLAKAFQPQGGTSLAGSEVAVSLTSNGTTSAAMGDAMGKTGASVGQTVILDGYNRAYTMNIAGTIGRSALAQPMLGSLIGDVRTTNLSRGPIAVSLNVAQSTMGQPAADVRKLGLSDADARAVRILSGRMLAQVGKRTQAVFGMAEGAGRLAAMLDGRVDMPFLVAREPDSTPGFAARQGQGLAIRRDLGFAGVTISSERGVVTKAAVNRLSNDSYKMANVRFDRRFGGVAISGGAGMMIEEASVLGARFGAALGGRGSVSKMLDLRVDWAMGNGWSLSGAVRQGWTDAKTGGALMKGRMSSNAFAFDVSKVGLRHRFGLRVSQPMRVEAGGYDLNLATSFDYATGEVGYTREHLGLAPKGREIDVEAAYGRQLAGGWIDANLFLRNQPGNIANASADRGMAIRFSKAF